MAEEIIEVRAKKAIAAIIKTVVPKAVVYPWWVIGKGIGVSLPELESVTDDTFVSLGQRFIHGYCIGVTTLNTVHVANNIKYNNPFGLKIWGFYEFRNGTAAKNSEDIFVTHLRAIQRALSRAPKLEADNLYSGIVKQHGDLQFDDELDTYGFGGDKKVFIARGTMTVDVTDQIVQQ